MPPKRSALAALEAEEMGEDSSALGRERVLLRQFRRRLGALVLLVRFVLRTTRRDSFDRDAYEAYWDGEEAKHATVRSPFKMFPDFSARRFLRFAVARRATDTSDGIPSRAALRSPTKRAPARLPSCSGQGERRRR